VTSASISGLDDSRLLVTGPLATSPSRHIPELDAIRGLAAFAVVLYHRYPYAFFLGWSFVDCFFVLSGYLITRILLENAGSSTLLRAFYFRRILRIWPVYFATLFLVVFVNSISRVGRPMTLGALLQHAVFLQNIQALWFAKIPPFPFPFAPSWSVAVEEQFYLLWPIVLIVFGRRCVPIVAVLLIAVSTIYQVTSSEANTLLSRGDGIAAGCALAILITSRNRERVVLLLKGALLTGLTILAVSAVWWWGEPNSVKVAPIKGAVLFFWGAIGLAICNSGHRFLAPLRWRLLRRLGLISYSLYMLHVPVFCYMPGLYDRLRLSSTVGRELITWAVVLIVPICSYNFIEKPALSFKRLIGYAAS
jgi:peptidoglycan/LPS O-acetylase OafA/YrhL